MRSAVFTVAADLLTALLEGKDQCRPMDSTSGRGQRIWRRQFNLEMATLLLSNLMNAVDVEQIVDLDVVGNDNAGIRLKPSFVAPSIRKLGIASIVPRRSHRSENGRYG